MYPGKYLAMHPHRPAFIMASTGEAITYSEFERRSNRLAHLLRSLGMQAGDHFSIFMENHPRYLECNAAGERSGLYYTCINSFLKSDEVAYILDNSEAKVLITSAAKLETARAALKQCSRVSLCLVVDEVRLQEGEANLNDATADFPVEPIPDECLGGAML